MASIDVPFSSAPTSGAMQVRVADKPWSRFLGLMGRRSMDRDEALYVKPCSSIHTFFMRFAIDVAFVDKQGTVVKTVAAVKPWRIALGGRGAHAVVEFPAGTLVDRGITRGSRLIGRRY